MTFKERVRKFKEENEKKVVDKQKEVLHYAMDQLWIRSPHYRRELSEYDEVYSGGEVRWVQFAQGEYDANHKVVIDGITTPWNPPTGSEAGSFIAHKTEELRINSIDDIGKTVAIKPGTDHDINVETGVGWQQTEGYFPYESTTSAIAEKFREVLE